MRPTSILSNPIVYDVFQRLLGSKRARTHFVNAYILPIRPRRVLDVGCGPGDLLNYLPPGIEFVGFDISEEYIRHAKERFGDRGAFFVQPSGQPIPERYGRHFDLAVATGLLHHLSDEAVRQLLNYIAPVLAASGAFVSIDPARTPEQPWIAKLLVNRDRGEYVRSPEAYRGLVQSVFPRVSLEVRSDLLNVPYTHAIITASLGTADGPET